ncbi:Bax inhibitor-1/YccA family protein [Saprospiraceae bacterium]
MDFNQQNYGFTNEPRSLIFHSEEEQNLHVSKYMTKVYGWMFLALMVTALASQYVASSETLLNFILGNKLGFWVVLLGQLGLVFYMTARSKIRRFHCCLLFFTYAALNGLVFGVILMAYTPASLLTVFAITAGTFGAMSAIGYFTKADLTSLGQIMFFGLIGLIIASVVNFFLKSSALYWILSYVGVAVFMGLIAYDTQKIKAYALHENEEIRQKVLSWVLLPCTLIL